MQKDTDKGANYIGFEILMREFKNESLCEVLKFKQSAIVEEMKLHTSDYWLVKSLPSLL